MPLDSADMWQLAGALVAAILIFVAAYSSPMKVSVGILLAVIPFQPVATRFGSANVVMTFVLAGALLVRGRLKYAPMLFSMLAVLFAYLVSVSQLPKSLYVLHGIEVIALVSGFLVFILAYNLARETWDTRYIVNILIVGNVLSVLYCMVQLGVGPGDSLQFFGAEQLALNKNRGGEDARLVGPFGSPGITAAYFMSLTLILIYEAVTSSGSRRYLAGALSVANIGMMMATANRGSFLVLLAGCAMVLIAFRERLGLSRLIAIASVSTIALIGSAALVSNYTDFANIFDRLEGVTETEDGLPATRAVVWPFAIEHIKERPLTGHGPRLLSQHERRFIRVPEEQLVGPYPHNLYLYLLLTVGVVGTAAMLYFLFQATWRVYGAVRRAHFESDYQKGLLVTGTIVLICFFVDELKIEFLRTYMSDYVHFIFALFGIYVGWSDEILRRSAVTERKQRVTKEPTRPRAAPLGMSRSTSGKPTFR